jgi:glycosyltransferase involved in cell wall biosynthesis
MNLLLLDQFSDLGGAQHCLLDLLPAFHRRGWKTVVAAPGRGPMLERALQAGATVEGLSFGTYSYGRKSLADIVRFTLDFPRALRQIRGLIARHRIDLLYINGPRLVPSAICAAGRSIPVVFHCHSFVPRPYGTVFIRLPLAGAKATAISSSEFTARSIWSRTPLRVIYNGVPDRSCPRTRADTGFRIGVIGRIAPQKGQLLFVQAARLIRDALPESSFEICGAPLFSDPESIRYDKQVRLLAQDLPVEFTGWTDEVSAVLARLDLLVVPSTGTEATTRVILEAFSAGVPVVAFATGGIPEVISDGSTGFLVAEETPEALAKTISATLSKERHFLSTVAALAHKEWERRFRVERFQSDIVELLDRIGGGFETAKQSAKDQPRTNRNKRNRSEDHGIAKA